MIFSEQKLPDIIIITKKTRQLLYQCKKCIDRKTPIPQNRVPIANVEIENHILQRYNKLCDSYKLVEEGLVQREQRANELEKELNDKIAELNSRNDELAERSATLRERDTENDDLKMKSAK